MTEKVKKWTDILLAQLILFCAISFYAEKLVEFVSCSASIQAETTLR